MHNAPTGYADPTGHTRVVDEDLSKDTASMDCKKYSRYCNGGKKKSNKELQAMHPMNQKQESMCDDLLITDFGDGDVTIGSWDCGQIDPVAWDDLLKTIGEDVNSFSIGWYDTPFYNRRGLSTLTGTGCFGEKCYTRTELNYIGEGEALAALGLSKEATHNVVSVWKNKGPIVKGLLGLDSTPREVSEGTYEMTDIGWNYYREHYSTLTVGLVIAPPGLITGILP